MIEMKDMTYGAHEAKYDEFYMNICLIYVLKHAMYVMIMCTMLDSICYKYVKKMFRAYAE